MMNLIGRADHVACWRHRLDSASPQGRSPLTGADLQRDYRPRFSEIRRSTPKRQTLISRGAIGVSTRGRGDQGTRRVNGIASVTVRTNVALAQTAAKLAFRVEGQGGITSEPRSRILVTRCSRHADCHLLSLEVKTGKEKGARDCDLDRTIRVAARSLSAVTDRGVSGDDPDITGYVESHDRNGASVAWSSCAEEGAPDPIVANEEMVGRRRQTGSADYDPASTCSTSRRNRSGHRYKNGPGESLTASSSP